MAVVTHINPLLLAIKKKEKNTTLLNFVVSTTGFCFFFYLVAYFCIIIIVSFCCFHGFVSSGHVVKQRLICPLLLRIPESEDYVRNYNSQTNHGIVEMGWEHALCQHGPRSCDWSMYGWTMEQGTVLWSINMCQFVLRQEQKRWKKEL